MNIEKINTTIKKQSLLLILAIFASVFGIFFRMYMLKDQILLNDEWHSMSIAINQSFAWIFTNFSIPNGFTSTPLNIYEWLLLHTIGWSELSLRLPSLILGIICVCAAPYLARNIIGRKAALTLTALIAISPVLIFYSRISRPYSAVACFGMLCLIYAARWMKSGRLSDGIWFAVCGVMAVYWHLFAAVSIGTIALAILLVKIQLMMHPKQSDSEPSWRQILFVMGGAGIAGSILILPALINSMNNSMSQVAGQSSITLWSCLRAASLFAGTSIPVLVAIFWILVLTGIIYLWKTNKWLSGTITACFIMQMIALAIVRPKSCDAGIVLTRYSVLLVPVSLMSIAYALQSILDSIGKYKHLKPALKSGLILAFIISLFLAGPMPRILSYPNNFTNHGVFQDNYQLIDWSKSFCSEFAPYDIAKLTVIQVDEISPFYAFLQEQNNRNPIIEYPMPVGNHLNPFCFYQWYHQRPIFVGYTAGMSSPRPLKGGGVYGNTYIDDILNIVTDKTKLHFNNMINMNDAPSIKSKNIEYIIFHKHFEAKFNAFLAQPDDMTELLQKYRQKYKIAYEDNNIVVFKPKSIESL